MNFKKSEVRVAAQTINSASPELFPDGEAIAEVVAGAIYKECKCSLERAQEIGKEFSAILDKVHGNRAQFAPGAKLTRTLLAQAEGHSAAVELGRLGGSKTSEAKTLANRAKSSLPPKEGSKPRGRPGTQPTPGAADGGVDPAKSADSGE